MTKKTAFAVFVMAASLATPALAQTPTEASTALPDRIQLDVGYFRIKADTTLRFNSVVAGSDVSLEKDLGVPSGNNTFWVEATWRISRRNQLEVNYTRLTRDRSDFTLQRDFQWGGQTYNAGLSATATTGTDILAGYYRFAVVRTDRFEIGPTAGFGWLRLRAGIQASGNVAGVTRSIDESETTGAPTGALGGYTNIWLTRSLVVRGDLLYLKAHISDSEVSDTDGRIGADYYFVRNAGIGVQYKYNKYTYDRALTSTKLGGEVTYKGFQVFLTLLL